MQSILKNAPLMALLFIILGTTANGENSTPNLSIVNGTSVDIEDYPYQASIQYRGRHFCGGSILSDKFILTAAHCTENLSSAQLSVRLGSSLRNNGGTVYKVSKVDQHPAFNGTTYDYDVAVLTLDSAVTFGPGVKTVTLSTSGTIIPDGLPAVVTGWGRVRQGGLPSTQLQMVVLSTISTSTCATFYPQGYVTERMFCAGVEDGTKDTCDGDSGGPLVVSGILIGITSWGITCARAGQPGAYSKIPNLLDYIDSIIN